MNIIHTADWHLGQTFFEYDRTHEHDCFLEWLSQQIESNNVELLLIAGDIFDSPNPSAESQKRFYDFLCSVTKRNNNLKIIITAGNHDSGARLEAPDPILESLNVTVRGVVRRTNDGKIDFERLIVPVNDRLCCLAVPYLRQGDYVASESYDKGVQSMYSELYRCAKERFECVIAMGHLQATGSEISVDDRSERTTIGGLDRINPSAFDDGIAYTALGHLHKAQRVSGRENVRYSGAPLPMSFAERNNRQSVTLVKLIDGVAEIEKIEFDTPVKLLSIPCEPLPIENVLEEIASLPMGAIDNTSPLLEIKVLITEPEPGLRNRIEDALEGHAVRLVRIEAVTRSGEDTLSAPMSYEELKKMEPAELAKSIYCQKYGTEDIPAKIKELLTDVIKEIEEEEK